MSLSLAIAMNLILAVSLLGALAYSMSRAARLTPHRPAARRPALRGLRGDRAPIADEAGGGFSQARAA